MFRRRSGRGALSFASFLSIFFLYHKFSLIHISFFSMVSLVNGKRDRSMVIDRDLLKATDGLVETVEHKLQSCTKERYEQLLRDIQAKKELLKQWTVPEIVKPEAS